MSKTKELDKKDPFQGSIDVRRDLVFEEDYLASRIQWSYNNGDKKINGECTPACFTKQLKQLFMELDVNYKMVQKESIVLRSEISPLRFDKLAYNGPDHVRIYFSGLTPSDFKTKREEIESFLDERNISHKMYCPWVCPENAKQHELTSKFLTDFEKLR